MQEQKKLSLEVDQNELRFNQVLVSLMLLLAFFMSSWKWVAFQAGVFFIASLMPRLHPYRLIYVYLFLPLKIVKPDLREDRSEAHRFAVLLGFLMTTLSSYLIASGYSQIGWGIVWLIVALTVIAVLGWCAGCFTYYMLNRFGLSRFFKHGPVSCTIPGARPPKSTN